jgi:two-component system, response regulator PdtaR
MAIDPLPPALPTSIPAAPFGPPNEPIIHRYTILVADDDPGNREVLSGLLQDRGFVTVQAGSGEEAIDIVRVEMIHLIFFDMHMPRMTGLEALQQVRMINELLPAILMTADVTRELMRQALQAQVYSVIPKPVNKNVVLHTMLKALQKMYGQSVNEEPKPGSQTPS